jgi:hypothetical protein
VQLIQILIITLKCFKQICYVVLILFLYVNDVLHLMQGRTIMYANDTLVLNELKKKPSKIQV